jgi:predicted dehydrogenase
MLRVGIAGFGVVGKKRYHYINENPFMDVVAISDIRFEDDDFTYHAKKVITDPGTKIYEDYNQLLEQNFDVLFVSLPNHLAPDATIKALNKLCHVFCEKPPGRTVKDIEDVIKVEKANPELKLKYGFNHRYHGSVEKAKEIIDTCEYGEIVNFRGVYGKSSIVPFSGGWRCERKYSGGGILLDQGIHMLDMLLFFHGEFSGVHSYISNKFWHHDVEDNAFAILRDDKGVLASINSSATQWQHRFRLEIALEKGSLELSGILSGSKSYGEEKLKIIPREGESLKGAKRETTLSYLEDNSWRDEVNEFASAIINNNPIVNGCSKDALNVMKLVYNIYYADEEWRKINKIKKPD